MLLYGVLNGLFSHLDNPSSSAKGRTSLAAPLAMMRADSLFVFMMAGKYERNAQFNSNIERLSRGVAPQSAHEERCTTGNKQLRLSHPGRMPHNSPYNTAPCCVLPYQHDNYHQLPAAHLASPTATVSLAPATSLSSVRRLP